MFDRGNLANKSNAQNFLFEKNRPIDWSLRYVSRHSNTVLERKNERKVTSRQKNPDTFRQFCLRGAIFVTNVMLRIFCLTLNKVLFVLWGIFGTQWVLVGRLSVSVLSLFIADFVRIPISSRTELSLELLTGSLDISRCV